MDPIFIVLISVAAAAALAVLIWLYMIAPGKRRPEIEKYKELRFAHRGLYNGEREENSLSAFAAAKAHGFGIELDVRLSKDGELVVFHDDNLSRIVGKEGKVKDFTVEELGQMRLGNTEDTIPTFKQVLQLIDGAVPLLIEMKVNLGESGVAERLIEEIEGYKGDYIVESFNPLALHTLKKKRPDILRGILSSEYREDKFKGKPLYKFLKGLYANFLIRPDFIAYEKTGYAAKNLRFIRRNYGTALMAWTVKSAEEDDAAIAHGFDTVIFEGYVPDSKAVK